MIPEIVNLLQNFPDGKILFSDPVRVKSSPHIPVFDCYGAWLDGEKVYLMDRDERWHGPLDESQRHADLVAASLLQRLKILNAIPA